MYYTVIKHSGHLRTLENVENTCLRSMFSTFPSCSQMPVGCVLSQCNILLRLHYLLNTVVCMLMMHNLLQHCHNCYEIMPQHKFKSEGALGQFYIC